MGRRRKNSNADMEPRLYAKHGAFYYVHTDNRWEHLGHDKAAANRKAKVYNDPDGKYGTLVHWFERFLLHLANRVHAKDLSQRTLDDYTDALGTEEKPGALRTYFAPPRTPLDVTPASVALFLKTNAEAGRGIRANRERAALSVSGNPIIPSHGNRIFPTHQREGARDGSEEGRFDG